MTQIIKVKFDPESEYPKVQRDVDRVDAKIIIWPPTEGESWIDASDGLIFLHITDNVMVSPSGWDSLIQALVVAKRIAIEQNKIRSEITRLGWDDTDMPATQRSSAILWNGDKAVVNLYQKVLDCLAWSDLEMEEDISVYRIGKEQGTHGRTTYTPVGNFTTRQEKWAQVFIVRIDEDDACRVEVAYMDKNGDLHDANIIAHTTSGDMGWFLLVEDRALELWRSLH